MKNIWITALLTLGLLALLTGCHRSAPVGETGTDERTESNTASPVTAESATEIESAQETETSTETTAETETETEAKTETETEAETWDPTAFTLEAGYVYQDSINPPDAFVEPSPYEVWIKYCCVNVAYRIMPSIPLDATEIPIMISFGWVDEDTRVNDLGSGDFVLRVEQSADNYCEVLQIPVDTLFSETYKVSVHRELGKVYSDGVTEAFDHYTYSHTQIFTVPIELIQGEDGRLCVEIMQERYNGNGDRVLDGILWCFDGAWYKKTETAIEFDVREGI